MADIGTTLLTKIDDKLNNTDPSTIKGFFTEDKLKTLLGPDGFKTLCNSELDATRNFLSGQITSPLKKIQNTEAFTYSLTAATQIAGAALQSYTFLSNVTQDIMGGKIQQVITDLTTAAVRGVMERGASLIEKNVRTLLALPSLDDLQRDITTYFFAYRMTLSEAMTQRGVDFEEMVANDNEERKKSKFSEFMDKVSYRVTKISYGATQIINKAEPHINNIISYYQMGPSWLSNQMNNELDAVETMLTYYIDPFVEDINHKKEEFIKEQVEKLAQVLVEQYNKVLLKEADKIIAKAHKLKVKATTKANAALAKAQTKISEISPIPIKLPALNTLEKLMPSSNASIMNNMMGGS